MTSTKLGSNSGFAASFTAKFVIRPMMSSNFRATSSVSSTVKIAIAVLKTNFHPCYLELTNKKKSQSRNKTAIREVEPWYRLANSVKNHGAAK